MKKLKVGDKVKYINPDDPYKKEVLEGTVHAIKVKERPNGDGTTTIIDRTYLIDTGEKVINYSDDIDQETGEVVGLIPYETDQPVQIEVRIKQ